MFASGLVARPAWAQGAAGLAAFYPFTAPDVQGGNADGAHPAGGLIAGPGGGFYGTTFDGGAAGGGTIFRLGAGGALTVLHSLRPAADGASVGGGLCAGPDGSLYGTAGSGGAGGKGTVFALAPDGSGFRVLHAFAGPDGGSPASAPTLSGGSLYGVTEDGGAGGSGTVFRVKPDGSGFTTLYAFSGGADGASPLGALLDGGDGFLYGTAFSGGSGGSGTVFKIAPDGTGFLALYAFSGVADGGCPAAGLTRGGDGFLYGTAAGGIGGTGALFKLRPDGSGFQALHAFTGADGAAPQSPLALGADGFLYGASVAGGADAEGALFKIAPDGTGFAKLADFSGVGPEGGCPGAGLTAGPDGAWYGTAFAGGVHGGSGVVFRFGPAAAPAPAPAPLHMLWADTDGRAMFWDVNADGSASVRGGYGPYTDGAPANAWTALALATGPDGVSHLLWTNTDGRAMLWDMNGDGTFTVIGGYGPYTDDTPAHVWSAVGLSVGPDNVLHLLWGNSDRRAMFWDVNGDGSFSVAGGYGPYYDDTPAHLWAAAGLATGPDGVSHLLWNNDDGRAMLWDVTSGGAFTVIGGYGPYYDDTPAHVWSAVGLSVGPDNVLHPLWDNTDHRAMFWDVGGSDGSFTVAGGYGPYYDDTPAHLWDVRAGATTADGVTRLLWGNGDGRAMLWGLNGDGSFSVIGGYGPYTDGAGGGLWNAVGLSAGP